MTPQHLIVAVALMLVGIGALGRITGSMAPYFVRADASLTNPHVEHLEAILDCWDIVAGDQHKVAAQLLRLLACDPSVAGVETENL